MTLLSHAHWPSKRLRFLIQRDLSEEKKQILAKASQVTFLPMDKIGEQGYLDLSLVRQREDVQSGFTQFFDGDVLVAKITPCFENGKGGLVNGTFQGVGFGTTELHVLTPASELDGRFLYYVTISAPFRKLGEACMKGTAGQKRVPEEFILDYKMIVPSLRHQCAIADYLDHETTRIDALVAAKTRLLELLAEKHQALTTHAVTRGLNAHVTLHNSNIPWLSEIPNHWETKRAKWLFSERDERSIDGIETLLSLRMERGLVPHNEVSEKLTSPEELVGYKRTSRGEIVINRMRAVIGLIAVTPQDGLVSPDYAVFVPSKNAFAEYYVHLFRTDLLGSVFRSVSTGLGTGSSGFLRLYSEAFLALWLPHPSISDQRSIAYFINRETKKFEAIRNETTHSIELLKERRAALISTAVTGQIDVGGIA
jgi:type I restriction enzyme, S subunit